MSHPIVVGAADQSLVMVAIDSSDNSFKTDLVVADIAALVVTRVGASDVSIASPSNKSNPDDGHSDGAVFNDGSGQYLVDITDATAATYYPSLRLQGTWEDSGAGTSGLLIGLVHPMTVNNPNQNVYALATTIKSQTQYPDGYVYIDTTGGAAGSTLGTHGTIDNPVDNLADAITLATALGSYRIRDIGPATLVSSLTMASADLTGFTIDLNGALWTFGASVTTSYTTWLNGSLTGSTIAGGTPVSLAAGDRMLGVFIQSRLQISGAGLVQNCTIGDGVHLVGTSDVTFADLLTTGEDVIDFNSQAGTIRLHGINGDATVRNLTSGMLCYYGRGQVTLESSCTGGTIAYSDGVKVTNEGDTTEVKVNSVPTEATISTAILDAALTEPTGMVSWASITVRKALAILFTMVRNKVTSDSDSVNVRNDADDATLWSYPTSDDGSTFSSGEGT